MPVFEHNGKYGLFIHIPKTGGKSIIEYLKDGGCRVSFTNNASSVLGLAGLRRPEWDATWQVPSELLQERDMSRPHYWMSHEAEQVCLGFVVRDVSLNS